MEIEQTFNYEPHWGELADEFTEHDSEYQAKVICNIGLQFKIWSRDKTRTSTYIQLLEIAEQLDDSGKWFIEILCDYMKGKAEMQTSFEDWLNSFNTDSATECFTAVQELKKQIEKKQNT